jgi:hypothetical protein
MVLLFSGSSHTFIVHCWRWSFNVNCSVPQGSVLCPAELNAYTEDEVDVYTRHQVAPYVCRRPALYCTQLLAALRLQTKDCWHASMMYACGAQHDGCRWTLIKRNWSGSAPTKNSESCPTMIEHWSSTELLFIHLKLYETSAFFLTRKWQWSHTSVNRPVSTSAISAVFVSYAATLTSPSWCNYPLRLYSAFILSHIDYCNVALSDLPASKIAPLQRVQNAAARHVYGLGPRNPVTSALVQLHWLPIAFRI